MCQFIIDINGNRQDLSVLGNYCLIPKDGWIMVEKLSSDNEVQEEYVLHQETDTIGLL